MKRYLLLQLFFGVCSFAFPQQDPQYSQIMFNQMAINPGYSGSNDMICVTALNRQQWIGFEGAPSTTIFNVNAPFKLFNINSGAGLGIQKDKAGFDDNLSLSLAYAYRMEIGTGKLGIGLGIGFFNKTLEPEWVIPSSDYHFQPSEDPLIPENNESYIALDIGFGIYYRTDELYLGISTTHLNEAKIKYTEGSTPYLARHYYLIAGYHLPINNPLFEITPCLFIYSDGKTSQLSINTNVLYNKKFWGGVTYRAGNAIVGMAGMELFNGVRVGYAYDFATSDIRKNSKGSHEFMLSYCFSLSIDRSPQRYKSVRFL